MILVLLQEPIVVEVGRAAEETTRITYPEVILNAVGAAGVIMLVATLVGLAVGGTIVFLKRRADASTPVTDSGHTKLRL